MVKVTGAMRTVSVVDTILWISQRGQCGENFAFDVIKSSYVVAMARGRYCQEQRGAHNPEGQS